MKTPKSKSLLVLGALGLLIGAAYTNCSNPKFDAVTDLPVVNSTGNIVLPPGSTQDDRETIVKKVCEPGNTVTKTQTIHFENPRNENSPKKSCNWGVGGNEGNENLRQSTSSDPVGDINRETEDKFTARVEQKVDLDLPDRAVICDMDFDFPTQNMKYDDHMFFLYDDVVLAATKPIDHLLSKESGMSIYDWTRLVMKPWKISDSVAYTYCLGLDSGNATCQWPKSMEQGQIKLDYSPATLQRVTARNLARQQHSFTMITTGDNNPDSDCQHSAVTFKVTFKYSSL